MASNVDVNCYNRLFIHKFKNVDELSLNSSKPSIETVLFLDRI